MPISTPKSKRAACFRVTPAEGRFEFGRLLTIPPPSRSSWFLAGIPIRISRANVEGKLLARSMPAGLRIRMRKNQGWPECIILLILGAPIEFGNANELYVQWPYTDSTYM